MIEVRQPDCGWNGGSALEGLYRWIQNLTGYFLFLSALDHLLPEKKYARYIRLFAGMVLILLAMQPLTAGLRLEERIARYYEAFVFRYQTDDLKQEILGVEKQRMEALIGQYERAVEQDVERMAEDAGFAVQACQAEIGRQEDAKDFGTVTGIWITVGAKPEERGWKESESGKRTNVRNTNERAHEETFRQEADSVSPVEPVEIGVAAGIQNPDKIRSSMKEQPCAEAKTLRRNIASYYNLEESYVEVQVVEGKDKCLFLLTLGAMLCILAFPAEKMARKTEGGTGNETGMAGSGQNGRIGAFADGKSGPAGTFDSTDLFSSLEASAAPSGTYESTLEKRVREILKHVEGVGAVDVMIVLKSSAEKVVHVDASSSLSSTEEQDASGGTRNIKTQEQEKNAVLLSGDGKNVPLIEKEWYPEISGIVISAAGGGDPAVRAEISAAMEALFNLPVHKIKVLKRAE